MRRVQGGSLETRKIMSGRFVQDIAQFADRVGGSARGTGHSIVGRARRFLRQAQTAILLYSAQSATEVAARAGRDYSCGTLLRIPREARQNSSISRRIPRCSVNSVSLKTPSLIASPCAGGIEMLGHDKGHFGRLSRCAKNGTHGFETDCRRPDPDNWEFCFPIPICRSIRPCQHNDGMVVRQRLVAAEDRSVDLP